MTQRKIQTGGGWGKDGKQVPEPSAAPWQVPAACAHSVEPSWQLAQELATGEFPR